MYRLLLVFGLLILLYVLLRSAVKELRGGKGRELPNRSKDVMIQDPVCRTYVPKANAVSADVGGQTYFFCSQDCAHTFRQRLSS